jgi:cyclohexadienyl dehydratase
MAASEPREHLAREISSMLRRACMLVLAMLLLLHPAAAENSSRAVGVLDRIAASGVLRVGSSGDYRPFSYRDPASLEFSGIDIDMAASLAASLRVRLAIVKTSWPTLMGDLAAGKFDIAMGGISINAERQQRALFSIPYLVDGKTPIARCADRDAYATIAAIDWPETRVIVNPGGTNERFARDHFRRARVAVYPDNTTIFDEIVAGRADVMITDASETLLQQKLHPELCAIHPEAPFDSSEKAYLLPRDSRWKAFVDRWLHRAIVGKEYAAIADRWLR